MIDIDSDRRLSRSNNRPGTNSNFHEREATSISDYIKQIEMIPTCSTRLNLSGCMIFAYKPRIFRKVCIAIIWLSSHVEEFMTEKDIR